MRVPMSGAVFIYVVAGVVVAGLALGVWLLDARRNKEVRNDGQRFETDPSTGTPGIEQTGTVDERSAEELRQHPDNQRPGNRP